MTLDLTRDTIFLTLAGSLAHGTSRPGSDVDLRGVCIAPLDVRVSLFRTFAQFEGTLDGPLEATVAARLASHETAAEARHVKTETVIYDIAKFLRLCAAANPNALEILFADPGDWLVTTPTWQRLYDARHRFLTTRLRQTYIGYAMAQLARIESHRVWLSDPPDGPHERARFATEPEYRSAMKRWEAFTRWKRERNPERAALEARFGYDTKHAMHLVRMLLTGRDVLRSGELCVRRPEAQMLRAVRDGAFTYDELLAEVATLETAIGEAALASSLPEDVDYAAIDALMLALIRETLPHAR